MKDETITAHIEAVNREIAVFEIKYGVDYEQFLAKLERGESGDPFAYEREQDAMRWESLGAEKKKRKCGRNNCAESRRLANEYDN